MSVNVMWRSNNIIQCYSDSLFHYSPLIITFICFNSGRRFIFSDIKDGNLKSILGLFFNLSRYKQQQKALQQQQQQHNFNQNTTTAPASPSVNNSSSTTASNRRISSPSTRISNQGALNTNNTEDNNVNNAVNNANTTADTSPPLDNVKSNMSSR